MQNPGVGWIAATIIGGIAGWLAEMIMKSNMGVLMNIVLGIGGAIVANALLGILGISLSGWLGYLVAGFVGACILIAVGRLVSAEQGTRRLHPEQDLCTEDGSAQMKRSAVQRFVGHARLCEGHECLHKRRRGEWHSAKGKRHSYFAEVGHFNFARTSESSITYIMEPYFSNIKQ